MLVLQMRMAAITPDVFARIGEAIEILGGSYRALLEPTLKFQDDILGAGGELVTPSLQRRPAMGVVRSRRRNVRTAEVFTDAAKNLYIVVVRSLEGGYATATTTASVTGKDAPLTLYVYFISRDTSSVPLTKFEDIINETLGIKLEPTQYTSNRLDELKSEGMEPPTTPDETDLASARLLADSTLRTLAVAVKSSGGLLIGDLPKQVPAGARGRIDDLRSKLLSAGIVSAELIVICKRTQAQVARAPTAELVKELSKQGLKCACGRPIAGERVEEAITITDHGKHLLDKSRWFSLLLLQELLELKVPLNHILLDQQVGGDEMDCVADISGELALFELKDKEFSLGNAYPFGAKIGIIRPKHPVIVTTEHVGNDAKEHFQRAEVAGARRRYDPDLYEVGEQPQTTQYIEGVENLRPGLEDLVTRIYGADAREILAEVLPLAAIDPKALLEALQRHTIAADTSAKPLPRRGQNSSTSNRTTGRT
jgi:hypothetical protein